MKTYLCRLICSLVIWTAVAATTASTNTNSSVKCSTFGQKIETNGIEKDCSAVMNDALKQIKDMLNQNYNCTYFWSIYKPGYNCSVEIGCESFFEQFAIAVKCEAETTKVLKQTTPLSKSAASQINPTHLHASSTIGFMIIYNLLNYRPF